MGRDGDLCRTPVEADHETDHQGDQPAGSDGDPRPEPSAAQHGTADRECERDERRTRLGDGEHKIDAGRGGHQRYDGTRETTRGEQQQRPNDRQRGGDQHRRRMLPLKQDPVQRGRHLDSERDDGKQKSHSCRRPRTRHIQTVGPAPLPAVLPAIGVPAGNATDLAGDLAAGASLDRRPVRAPRHRPGGVAHVLPGSR